MSLEELEAEAMKLDPKARVRLAGKLLESLDSLSEEENEQLWAEEAERRCRCLIEWPGRGPSRWTQAR
jgi:hypothetical protein